ncbi:MAG TPA: hypothetical protein VMT20_18515 [Terriglobia bacterium]|nr:hypothetical protein [Terriglobia bacterium]
MNKQLLRGWMILVAGVVLSAPALYAQDVAAPPPDQPNANEIVIPEGTEFKLQLHTSINSKTSKSGDRVLTTLLDPVSVEDEDVLPKGVRIDGHLGEVKEAQRRGRGGYLTIVFDTVEMPNGDKLAIQGSLTEVFSATNGGSDNVGPEGDLKGGGANHKEQAAMIIAPAALGAAGGLTTGIVGAAAGIAIATLVPRGKQAALASGSLIGMRLDRDVTVPLPASALK